MPEPRKGEKHDEWIARCMGDEEQNKTFPEQKQRYAVCESKWTNRNKKKKDEMSTKSNLSMLSDKLLNGRWLLKPCVHTQLCKQLSGYMKNPTPLASDLVPPTQYTNGPEGAADHAIIYVHGILSKNVSEEAEQLLGLTDIDWFTSTLEMVAEDPTVKDIIVCFASPGGETTGIEEAGRKIVEIDTNIKPVYVWCENQMDSAAYWLGSQARKIGMTPSAQVGGVGVYVLVLDETAKMEKEGVAIEAISSGKFKMLGHEFRELTKEERNILQEDVDRQHTKFKNTILARRPNMSEDDMEGLSFNGEDALSKHFVDVLADNIDEFIQSIDNESISMKPEVTKVQAQAASTEVQKKEETKVEVAPIAAKTEVKKLSFFDKIKQLMGEYDGKYEAVPGVPGTEESKPANEPEGSPTMPATPTNYTETHEEPDGDECDCEYEECSHCKGTGKMKKAEEKKEEETVPPVKANYESAEGKYDGGYEKAAESAEVEVKAETKPETQTEVNPRNIYTVDEFRRLCSLSAPTKPKGLSEWQKACEEMATYQGPFEIKK